MIQLFKYSLLKRVIDVMAVMLIIGFLILPIILITIAVFITSPGPILYWSVRVGKYNRNFLMPKFRTMIVDTPAVATHLLQNPDHWLTPIGKFLRITSLDEIPQLWSIFIGDMSFVGPRPALYNQSDLISYRQNLGVDKITPGLTGWAQVNGRDNIDIREKVMLDYDYMQNMSFSTDIKIIYMTIINVIWSRDVSH